MKHTNPHNQSHHQTQIKPYRHFFFPSSSLVVWVDLVVGVEFSSVVS